MPLIATRTTKYRGRTFKPGDPIPAKNATEADWLKKHFKAEQRATRSSRKVAAPKPKGASPPAPRPSSAETPALKKTPKPKAGLGQYLNRRMKTKD